MQRLERLLSTNMAILAVIGATMLGLGQQDVKLILLVLIGAVASVVYTDRRKVFSLNHHLANVAALCAVGLALFDYSASDRNQQLLAIANLLVYLQVVVFFQEKNARIFGQLAMLSLLQVVVAAALNYSIFFGFLALGYMAVGLPTLSLFFFYRELGRFVPQGVDQNSSQTVRPGEAAAAEAARSPKPTRKRRWPLAGQVATFTGADFNQQEEAFGRGGLIAFTTRMAVMTVLLTIFIFIFAPRLGRTPWQTGNMEASRLVGYSEDVTLGELGGAVENPETVMRVTFFDDETQKKLHLTGSPLFRGSVVATYDLKNRRWSQYREGFGSDPRDLEETTSGMLGLVRQEIKLEPLMESAVFAISPVYAKNPARSIIRYDNSTKQLYREERDRDHKVIFSLWTTGIQNFQQSRLIPISPKRGIHEHEQNAMLKIPKGEGKADPFAGLKQVADDAIAASGVDENDPYAVAKALESFMLSGGNYKYSIEGQVRPNNDVDPIEDFVTRSRVGHCEYFASALALMLRHRGIPSRVVIGFKGGDWNSLGEYYHVRQLHAHAWVEAFFKRHQLGAREIELGPNDTSAWLTLDSTADILANAQQEREGLWAKTRSLADFVQMQWITYVVGLTREQQQEHIYKPLEEAYASIAQKLEQKDEEADKRNAFARLYEFLLQIAGGNWFSWRGLLVTVVGLSLLAFLSMLLGYLGRYVWKYIKRHWRWGSSKSISADSPEIAFYRQLESLLARHGFQRLPEQTQREFAITAGTRLALAENSELVSPLPRAVVDAFYAVRFGRRTLSSGQIQAVEEALAELKVHLAGPTRSNGHQPVQNTKV